MSTSLPTTIPARPSAGQSGFRRHAWLLLAYLVLGVLTTWPRATYLVTGQLPNNRDQGVYVWDMWWMRVRLFDPWYTHQIFAPVGAPLAYHDLMPLVGALMTPVTLVAGPVFSVNLLTLLVPGVLCYAMYRAARLWLTPVGAFAAGTFFGLSAMLAWRDWFHLNLAIGAVFLPLVLAAAIRLRRDPSVRRAVQVGLTGGLCLLVDQESTVLVVLVAAVVLLSGPVRTYVSLLGVAAAVGLVVASPQLIAMALEPVGSSPDVLAGNYVRYGVALPQLFTPSPRVAAFGLHWLGGLFYDGITTDGMPTFGVTLTCLALFGAVIGRRRGGRTWLLLWLCGCVMALGPVLYLGTHAYTPLPVEYHGQRMSALLPYTWFVRLPGLSDFREANRFTELGLLPAALLAGTAIEWLARRRGLALAPVVAVAALELGWSSVGAAGTVPAGLPAVDAAIRADPSQSLVVDVPLGFRSGTVEQGRPFPVEAQVEATVDGHPRAVGYLARLPESTARALDAHPFYADLATVQSGGQVSAPGLGAAAADAHHMDVGWVLVWTPVTPRLSHFLTATGFSFHSAADGVTLYQAT